MTPLLAVSRPQPPPGFPRADSTLAPGRCSEYSDKGVCNGSAGITIVFSGRGAEGGGEGESSAGEVCWEEEGGEDGREEVGVVVGVSTMTTPVRMSVRYYSLPFIELNSLGARWTQRFKMTLALRVRYQALCRYFGGLKEIEYSAPLLGNPFSIPLDEVKCHSERSLPPKALLSASPAPPFAVGSVSSPLSLVARSCASSVEEDQ